MTDLDAGSIHEGAKLTGSATGGILSAMVESLLTRWIHRKQEDAARKPGVAEMNVMLADGNGNKGFSVIAVANTPETPDALLDESLSSVIKGITDGVQDTRGTDNEKKNVQ